MNNAKSQQIIELLNADKVVVIPTDTIYGVVGKALSPNVVNRIYDIKGRAETKPFVILISDYTQLAELNMEINEDQKKFLDSVWPGPVSVVIATSCDQYLHRGLKSLAIRMPDRDWLRSIISSTGPLVATSANLSNEHYIHDIDKIKDIFTNKVDYISSEKIETSEPSQIINLADRSILR